MDAQMVLIDQTTSQYLVQNVRKALEQAMAGEGLLAEEVLGLEGMSGKKYRLFINNLIRLLDDPRYLEVGCWAGSTLCSAIYENTVRALAIDNWSQFGGPFEKFYCNLARFKPREATVSFQEEDFRKVNFSAVGKYNVYLFDGPHSFEDQKDGILQALPALDDPFVLIVDDWNWASVRAGTAAGLREGNLTVDFQVEVRTSLDDTQPEWRGAESDWHNGYYIVVASRN